MYRSNYFGTVTKQEEKERPEDKDYPFYPPQLTPPEWENIFPSVEGGYAIINGKNPDGPTIYFAKWVYEETMFMAKYAAETKKTEMACMLLYNKIVKNKPIWECFGYIPLPQEASAADVDIFFAKHWEKAKNWLKENYPDREFTADNEGHWHVHSNMNTFFSATDDKQQSDRNQLALNTGARIFVVVNEKKDIKARVIQYGPLTAVADDIAVGVSYACEEYRRDMTKERREYLKKMVDDLVVVKASTSYKYGGWEWERNNYGSLHSVTPKTKNKLAVKEEEPIEDLLLMAIESCPNIQEIVNSTLRVLHEQMENYTLYEPKIPRSERQNLKWYFDSFVLEGTKKSDQVTATLIDCFGNTVIDWLHTSMEGTKNPLNLELDEAVDLFVVNLLELISLLILVKGEKLELNNKLDMMNITHLELDSEDIHSLIPVVFNGEIPGDFDSLFTCVITALVESEA